ncbi:hypothetical protein [Spirochaeta isovalerica]|uniref:DoxX protein n=1 Tax=Spirochaeta isovalerica TaxID=150 RepID=A0A841R2Z7_9SPIO|nr:hypothetical protein [Spirochaeta isovalerica]MBB6479414.1 hypothetical protein [Spirochaeta isovalerica]
MKREINAMFFLQLSLALMFLAIGIVGITNYNSDLSQFGRSVGKVFGKSNDLFPIVFAVIQLVAGALLALSLFIDIPGRILPISLLIIFIFWAISIAMTFVLDNLFEPNFLVWLSQLSPQLVILTALWIVFRAE